MERNHPKVKTYQNVSKCNHEHLLSVAGLHSSYMSLEDFIVCFIFK